MKRVLTVVYDALKEKGYNPINQIVGYILSEDPTYITNHLNARALIRKPKIIVFDEATSALDSASEKKVQEATSNMMKNCTTFLVAHRLSTIRNADRIVAMRDGKIVEVGSYDELMEKKGYFYELKALQS